MKLTDESVAKALGWKRVSRGNRVWFKGDKGIDQLPKWTTSLDAIVDEVEARGLWWEVHGSKAYKLPGQNYEATVTRLQWDGAKDVDDESYEGDTPALALCQALLQFLREAK